MKKYSIIAALACILAAASCAKEIAPAEGQTGINPDKVALEVTAAKADFGTKAILEDTGYIAWEAGDAIKVWDGTALNDFTMKEGSPYNDNLSADFQGEASTGAGELLAIAPELAPSVVEGALKLTIPAVQTVDGDHAVDPQALLSVGTIEDGKVSLDNLFALVKVSVGETGVKSIMFQGKGAEAICGTAAYSAGALGAADGTSVTLLHADGTFPVGDYYISIFPQTLASGFDLVLTKADGSKLWKKTTVSTVFAQNGGVDFGEVTETTLGWLPSTITTAAQLVRWGKYAAFYAPDETVTLGADIDLAGAAWTPVPVFCGTFDGAGNKIYNFTVASGEAGHCGFIVDLGNGTDVAELKNVIFGSSDGTSYDGTSSITANQTSDAYTSSVEGWSIGPVGRALANAKVTGVTNFVPVTASATCAVLTRLGGIVGYASSGVIISGCVNNADVTNNSSLEAGAGNMGGILACAYNGTKSNHDKVIDCTNNGAITNNCGGTSKIGGIVGFFFKYGEVTGCANTGAVINNAACGTSTEPDNPYIGGIIGGAGYGSTTYVMSVKGCVNKGEVNQKTESPLDKVFIAGIVAYSSKGMKLTITKNGDQRTENWAPIAQSVEFVGDSYIGGIAGSVGNAESVIEYADNKAAATITSYSGQAAVYTDKNEWGISYGGIAAASKGTIRYCTNAANINSANGTSKKYPIYYLAGICAGCEDMGVPTLVDNCSNSGEIASTFGAGTLTKVGGICSTIIYPGNMTNCANTGNVSSNSSNKIHTLGSIVGLIDFSKATEECTFLEGCSSSCDVYVKYASNARTSFMVGSFQKGKPKPDTPFNINFGTAANPVKVYGSFTLGTGTTPVTLDAGNYTNYLYKRPSDASWPAEDYQIVLNNVKLEDTL